MRSRSSIFAAVASPRAKWLVFLTWFVVIFASFGAGVPEKYTDAQENESTSFLPGDAESTKALTAAEDLQGGELAPAVILYRRESGLTPADKQKIVTDVEALTAKRFQAVVADGATAAAGGQSGGDSRQAPPPAAEGCGTPVTPIPGQPAGYAPFVGPVCSEDGKAALVFAYLRGDGEAAQPARPRRLLARDGLGPGRRARGQDHRRRGLRGRRHQRLREHQRHAAVRRDRPGDRAADPDLPVADLPLHPARRGHVRRAVVADARLRARRVRRDDQRPVERDHVDPRARRGHGLRAADRRPLSRGDAPPGRQVRGDAGRADLRRPGGVRQRRDRDRRAVLPVARAGQRHERPRPARRARRVLRRAVDAHAAARAAADLRPPRVLAVRAAHAGDAPDDRRRWAARASPRSPRSPARA